MELHVILFEGFETLDVFGPVEILGHVETINISFYSLLGGIVNSTQHVPIETKKLTDLDSPDILLVPGGQGTRSLVKNKVFLDILKKLAEKANYCLSVCTGSALCAACGVLDGKRATSNKRAMDWVVSLSDKVDWVYKARWVVDGIFYTSSGISAGMDMTLGFVKDQFSYEKSKEVAAVIAYFWNEDATEDPFARINCK